MANISVNEWKLYWNDGAVSFETPVVSACVSWFGVQIANLDWCTVDARIGKVRLSIWTSEDLDKVAKRSVTNQPRANAPN